MSSSSSALDLELSLCVHIRSLFIHDFSHRAADLTWSSPVVTRSAEVRGPPNHVSKNCKLLVQSSHNSEEGTRTTSAPCSELLHRKEVTRPASCGCAAPARPHFRAPGQRPRRGRCPDFVSLGIDIVTIRVACPVHRLVLILSFHFVFTFVRCSFTIFYIGPQI